MRNSLEGPTSPPLASVNRKSVTMANRSRVGRGSLSSILGTAVGPETTEKSIAAFKMLPIDPTRMRRASSDDDGVAVGVEEVDEAASCREAVDMIVERMRRACEDAGSVSGEFIKVEDVVG